MKFFPFNQIISFFRAKVKPFTSISQSKVKSDYGNHC